MLLEILWITINSKIVKICVVLHNGKIHNTTNLTTKVADFEYLGIYLYVSIYLTFLTLLDI